MLCVEACAGVPQNQFRLHLFRSDWALQLAHVSMQRQGYRLHPCRSMPGNGSKTLDDVAFSHAGRLMCTLRQGMPLHHREQLLF